MRRLQTDVIDIYQIHWPDPNTAIEETAEAMAALYAVIKEERDKAAAPKAEEAYSP